MHGWTPAAAGAAVATLVSAAATWTWIALARRKTQDVGQALAV